MLRAVASLVLLFLVVLLLVVVECVASGRALVTNVAREHGHHVVGLNVPRHVITPAKVCSCITFVTF